jgi:hypothetical protein
MPHPPHRSAGIAWGFTSMYSTLFAMLWDHVIAERVNTVDATHDVQALLDTTTLDQLFDPVIR